MDLYFVTPEHRRSSRVSLFVSAHSGSYTEIYAEVPHRSPENSCGQPDVRRSDANATHQNRRKKTMGKERLEGAAQKTVGAAKRAIGNAVGNERLQAEGAADQLVGAAKEAVGKGADAIHKASR